MPRKRSEAPEPVYRTTTVKMPKELHKRLRITALNEERPASEILVEALEEWLKRQKR
ncbi:MAG: hypothetical protein AAF500_16425 [Myxococcota bacterium]